MRRILPALCIIAFVALVAASAFAGSYMFNNKKELTPSATSASIKYEPRGIMSPRWPLTDCCVIISSADIALLSKYGVVGTVSGDIFR